MTSHSYSTPTHQHMAWAPYSYKRETSTHKNPQNPASTRLPITWQRLLRPRGTMTSMKHPRKVNRRVTRWYGELQYYCFEIKHVPGKTHTAADFLSRPFVDDKGEQDNEDVVVLPPELFVKTAIRV